VRNDAHRNEEMARLWANAYRPEQQEEAYHRMLDAFNRQDHEDNPVEERAVEPRVEIDPAAREWIRRILDHGETPDAFPDAGGTGLLLYDRMRLALQHCSQIDDVVQLKGYAEKLRHYARIKDDSEAEILLEEIKRRAEKRIGELSRELDKAKTGPKSPKLCPTDETELTKEATLKAAGISRQTANRYEQLSSDDEGENATLTEGQEAYLADCRKKGVVPTQKGMLRRRTLRTDTRTARAASPVTTLKQHVWDAFADCLLPSHRESGDVEDEQRFPLAAALGPAVQAALGLPEGHPDRDFAEREVLLEGLLHLIDEFLEERDAGSGT
jgi:hypothetical protein